MGYRPIARSAARTRRYSPDAYAETRAKALVFIARILLRGRLAASVVLVHHAKQGGQVWDLRAKNEGHGFVKKANSDFADLPTIRFFEKLLLR